jgi:hypothetical protein
MVSVQDTTAGRSWHAASSSWRARGTWATAALAGGDTTRQTFRWVLPVVDAGHRYVAELRATDADGATAATPLPVVRFTGS